MSGAVAAVLLWRQRRPLPRAVGALAIVLVALVAITPSSFRVDASNIDDGHAIASLELAMNSAFCGDASHVSSRYRAAYDLQRAPELQSVPLRSLVERRAGSIPAYCGTVNASFVNNENSLMLLEASILRMFPGISLRTLGRILHWCRIALLSSFLLLVLACGGSIALAAGVALWAFLLFHAMSDSVYSVYPFLFVVVLGVIALHAFELAYGWTDRVTTRVVSMGASGLFAAFVVNLRSSYLPLVSVLFAGFLAADWLRPRAGEARRARAGRLVVSVAAFAAGFAVLQAGVIDRIVPADHAYVAVHPIAHPIVLGLGVPENDFSRSLHITWVDAAGERIAKEVDPRADYLGPRYNAALLTYYRELWTQYPRRMFATYAFKFAVTGKHMLTILRQAPDAAGHIARRLLAPIDLLPNGWWLLSLYAVLTFAAGVGYVKTRAVAAFAFALLGASACLLHVESGIIYSLYAVNYQNYLAFYVMFVTLCAGQALVNGAWRMLRPSASDGRP